MLMHMCAWSHHPSRRGVDAMCATSPSQSLRRGGLRSLVSSLWSPARHAPSRLQTRAIGCVSKDIVISAGLARHALPRLAYFATSRREWRVSGQTSEIKQASERVNACRQARLDHPPALALALARRIAHEQRGVCARWRRRTKALVVRGACTPAGSSERPALGGKSADVLFITIITIVTIISLLLVLLLLLVCLWWLVATVCAFDSTRYRLQHLPLRLHRQELSSSTRLARRSLQRTHRQYKATATAGCQHSCARAQ